MVQLSITLLALAGASAVVAHTGILADGGPEHLRMLSKRGESAPKKCTGTRRARKAYAERHSSAPAAASPKVQAAAAVEVKAVNKPSPTSEKKAEATYAPSSGGSSSGKGLFGWTSEQCGDSGAVDVSTDSAGPNGSQDWLNCGVSSGGWNPPNVKISDLKIMTLDDALKMPNSAFSPCAPLVERFDAIGKETGTCNPSVTGGGGESGLMQITSDKCGDAPGGNCHDVDYNLRTGAKYLKSRLDANDGNILLAMGEYNGWYKGLTTEKARAIRFDCWSCQQNLDYFQQMFNGWLQGLSGYKMGNVKNLAH